MKLNLKMRDAIEIFRSLSAAKASERPASATYGFLIGRNWRAFRDIVSDAEEARNKLLDKCGVKNPETGKRAMSPNGDVVIADMESWIHGNREIENMPVEIEVYPIKAKLFPTDMEPIVAAGLFDLIENEEPDSHEGEEGYFDDTMD